MEIVMINIALDGPAGAGKSWLAKTLAAELGYIHVDTGALYRSIGLYMQRKGLSLDDRKKFIERLPEITLSLSFNGGKQHVILCGEDVTDFIRTPEISLYASAVSSVPEVRDFLLETQRKLARENDVIMDGRDIGTVIIPDADVKIYVTASDEVRANRRMLELKEKGIEQSFENVLADMKKRDFQDASRDVAPAVAAEDAVILDNSELDREETLSEALRIIKEKIG
jgi:cytidylate kinase